MISAFHLLHYVRAVADHHFFDTGCWQITDCTPPTLAPNPQPDREQNFWLEVGGKVFR